MLKFWMSFLVCLPVAASDLINGAGASFPYPLYAKWFAEYQKVQPGVRINYQSIGSGGGIRQFTQKTVDFGASDAPMTDEQLKQAGAAVLHVPSVLGAVVLTYNVPGLEGTLNLSGPVVGDLFMGKIAKWDDPKLKALNPGLKLPSKPVLIVHRSDGSGTTQIFTDYLAKVSPAWKAKVGTGTAVKWPTGLGGKGNEGVSGLVKQTPGALGYVELIYARSNQLPAATLVNQAGKTVAADLESITAAAASAQIPDDFRVSVTDAAGAKAYPIAGFTYLLVWDRPAQSAKEKTFAQFLEWALSDGQALAGELHYAPLPKPVVQKVRERVAKLKGDAKASKSGK